MKTYLKQTWDTAVAFSENIYILPYKGMVFFINLHILYGKNDKWD